MEVPSSERISGTKKAASPLKGEAAFRTIKGDEPPVLTGGGWPLEAEDCRLGAQLRIGCKGLVPEVCRQLLAVPDDHGRATIFIFGAQLLVVQQEESNPGAMDRMAAHEAGFIFIFGGFAGLLVIRLTEHHDPHTLVAERLVLSEFGLDLGLGHERIPVRVANGRLGLLGLGLGLLAERCRKIH